MNLLRSIKDHLEALAILIRLPNSIFIFLVGILLYHFIVIPYLSIHPNSNVLNKTGYYLLSLSTTLIAMAGYIINDYFDVKIDEINKPYRVTVETKFKRRPVMIIHIIFNVIALGLAWYLCNKIGHPRLILIHIGSAALLLIYSASWKRKAIIGNLSIAFLIVLSVLTPLFYTSMFLQEPILINAYAWFYLFFAFMLTWIREIIKDLEDIKGDAQDGCQTMPIKYGISFSKDVLFGLIIIALIGIAYFFIQIPWEYSLFNIVFLAFIPTSLILLLVLIHKSIRHKDYKKSSRLVKLITFVGILLLCLLRK
jgi:4-hydroxybenzoate polyprenyltransferase